VIYAFLSKSISFPFLFPGPKQDALIAAEGIGLVILYYRKDRVKLILEKYSHESDKDRRKGNAIVAIYVSLSFLFIFVGGFFKAGKL
jgi:hypothetical protein